MSPFFDIMTLATLLGQAAQILSRLVRFTLFSVYFSGVPPSNWNNNKIKSAILHVKPPMRKGYVGVQLLLASEMERHNRCKNSVDLSTTKRILFNDVSACPNVPTPEDETLTIKIEEVRSEDNSVTVLGKSPSSEFGFSIYSDASSPSLNKALFITPPRPSLVSAQELEFNLLKAASERVSEILRENRRRLDAGEDSNTIRREARRKRAQELASRNKSARSS